MYVCACMHVCMHAGMYIPAHIKYIERLWLATQNLRGKLMTHDCWRCWRAVQATQSSWISWTTEASGWLGTSCSRFKRCCWTKSWMLCERKEEHCYSCAGSTQHILLSESQKPIRWFRQIKLRTLNSKPSLSRLQTICLAWIVRVWAPKLQTLRGAQKPASSGHCPPA